MLLFSHHTLGFPGRTIAKIRRRVHREATEVAARIGLAKPGDNQRASPNGSCSPEVPSCNTTT